MNHKLLMKVLTVHPLESVVVTRDKLPDEILVEKEKADVSPISVVEVSIYLVSFSSSTVIREPARRLLPDCI